MESWTRPSTSFAGTGVGSGRAFASPFVWIQIPSECSSTDVIRWVNITRSSPARSETTSPTLRSVAGTGSTMIADPRPIAGAIDPPPTMIVWRPVSGTTLARMTPKRTTRIRAMRTASRNRRTKTVDLPRTLIALSSSSPGRTSGLPVRCRPGRRVWVRPRPSRGTGPGAADCWLRVVDGLLGVEREDHVGRGALERRAGRQRQRDAEAERLGGGTGQGAVAEVRALGVRAERGAVERRAARDDDRAREAGAAPGDGLADLEGQRRAECAAGGGRHRVAERLGACIGDDEVLGDDVARHHAEDVGAHGRLRVDVDRAGRERPGRGVLVRELRERERAGAQGERGERR